MIKAGSKHKEGAKSGLLVKNDGFYFAQKRKKKKVGKKTIFQKLYSFDLVALWDFKCFEVWKKKLFPHSPLFVTAQARTLSGNNKQFWAFMKKNS